MVNGTLSRILYIGAFAIVGLVITAITVLAMNGHPVPGELQIVLPTLIAFIAGSQITPPNVEKTKTGAMVDPAATYTTKGGDG